MARTAQTARKSSGGQAPLGTPESRFHLFKDHAGNSVTTIYSSLPTGKQHIPRLSLHLYTLSTVKESAQELCELFLRLDGIIGWGNARNWWPRVDIYDTPLSSIEECMQHHRREKVFRKRNGGPHIVPTWSRRCGYAYRSYRNVIFVIDKDCGDWQAVMNRGLLSAQYDLDTRPEDQFEVLEAEDLDDPRDEGLVELNPAQDDPLIERVIIDREKEDEMRREQQVDWANGHYLKKHPPTLRMVWSDMTMALCDCTYRMARCDGCEEGFEHTDCAVEQLASHTILRSCKLNG
jgi:hypothetical protein